MANSTPATAQTVLLAQGQHVGHGRESIEDRVDALQVRTAGNLDLYIGLVADGIGGASAGENAGQIALDTVFDHIRRSRETNIASLLQGALEAAHLAVTSKQRQSRGDFGRMGTTGTLVAITPDHRIYVAHVGDSRAYLVRKRNIQLLTVDHTWGYEKVREGLLSQQEAAQHKRSDELARYIGQPAPIQVDMGLRLADGESEQVAIANQGTRLEAGDTIVICSDGLIKNRPRSNEQFVSEAEIVSVVSGNEPADTVKTLIGYALGREVDDNVSVVVMEVPGGKKSFRAIKPASAGGAASGAVLVAAGIGAILLAIFAVILFVIIIPALSGGPDVVIPDVPTGFAYVVEMEGAVSSEIPGSSPVQIAPGDFVQTGVGSLIRVGSGTVRLALPAGSGEVYLGENTVLGLDRVVDPTQGVTSTLLTLGKGQALAVASPLPGTTFTIQAPTTTRAEVTGTIIGIEYDETTQRFEVDCLEGNCRIVGLSRAAEMAACENYFLVSMGIPNGPNPTRNVLWQSIAGNIVPDASICGVQEVEKGPTPTFEPTLAIEPTATQRPFVPQPTPDAYGSGAFVLPEYSDGDGGRPGGGAGEDDTAQANNGTSVLILMSVIGGVALSVAAGSRLIAKRLHLRRATANMITSIMNMQ